MSLFTVDAHFVMFMDVGATTPSQESHSRAELAPVFAHLNTCPATTHFNGQSTVTLDGDRATGEGYCLAQHLSME